jgi:L-asparagine transporter-like permease
MFPIWAIGWTLLTALTGVNLMSTRSYGEFEFWFASIKVGAIIVFITLGLAFVLGHSPLTQVQNLYVHGGFSPFGPAAILTGVVSVILALCGGEIATIAAAESPDAARMISRMTGSVTLRILLFYVVSISLIVIIVPWNQIHSGTSPFTTALQAMHIPAAALAMKLIVLTAVLSCLNSCIYVTSRVMFVLSAKGDAPKYLVKLNGRLVPYRAILLSSFFGYIAVYASVISPERVFAFLVNAAGSLMIVIYIITALAQIRLRYRFEKTAPERLKFKVWLFPWFSWAAVAAMAAVLLAMLIIPPRRSEVLSGLTCLVIALALYAAFRLGRDRRAPDAGATISTSSGL